jgi:dipeptidyl aminopeptidase/acylaminoacyl peptidase
MAELTAEMIVDLTVAQTPHISPDGTQVAYTSGTLSKKGEHTTSAIWLVPFDGSQPARQFTSGDTHDHHPRWSPDGSQIAFLSDRATRGTDQLYLIAPNGGEAKALLPTTNKRGIALFAWSPQGGLIAFLSADEPTDEDERREKERDDALVFGERRVFNRLRLLSLASQEITTLVSQDRHVTELSWHPQGQEIAYITRQAPELEFTAYEHVIERVSLAGSAPRIVARFPKSISDLHWSPDGQYLYFSTSASAKAQSSAAIFRIPVEDGEIERVAGGETSCAEDFLSLQPSQPYVALSLAEGLDTTIYQQHIQTGTLTKLYSAPGNLAWDINTRADGTLALAVVQGIDDQPQEIWTGQLSVGEANPTLTKITNHHEHLAGITFGLQESFRWTAPDGLELDGVLVLPPNAPKDMPLPTIMLVHGGPYGRWGRNFNVGWSNWAQWLALAGYAIIMPNPRGGKGHGDTFATAAQGRVGFEDFGDVMAMVDAAIERGIADPDRLAIGGWSQGGYMSAWAVTQTDRFKAAIIGAGVTDWGMMVATSDLPQFERELGGSAPWEGAGPHAHAQNSPISFAQKTTTPVLILHGERDERVPLSQAVVFHRALREGNVPAQFVVYPREPHGIRERAHQIDLLQRVRSWYDRWLHV